MEHHPNGRHRRPRQSLAGRVWALTAAMLAVALAYVFVPEHPRRPRPERTAITPPPRHREPPPAPARQDQRQHQRSEQDPPDFPADDVRRTSASRTSPRWRGDHQGGEHVSERRGTDPAEAAGALVRPYLAATPLPSSPPPPPPSPRRTPLVPGPRIPAGDLLDGPVDSTPFAAPTAPTGPAGSAAPAEGVADDMGDLAAVIRLYLDRVG
ncbi:hypothetical protein HNR06_001807 [Nocardiopsis arvandica]|uniref:Uncharacterized protein n=1 Tax=Nocardiopsis sinuspersici TaxID=501010 RepID=A0A7Z0BI20_9ACTN|nr:hypothetical protein [Nocardiopsis sinuspersici]